MSSAEEIAELIRNFTYYDRGYHHIANITAMLAASKNATKNASISSISSSTSSSNITWAEEIFTASYIPYLMVGQYWFSLICYLFSLCCFSKLCHEYLLKGEETSLRFTPCITVFLSFATATSLFSFIHLLYLALNWRPQENLYNVKTLFWTGVLQVLFQIGFSCALFFQTFDRIIHLLLSHRYSYRSQKSLAFLSLLFICGILLWTCLSAVPSQIEYSFKKVCRTSSCQIFNGPGIIFLNSRFVISGINAVLGALFFVVFRVYLQRMKASRRSENQRLKKMRTPMISVAIVLEFLLVFSPFCIAFYTFRVFGENLSTYMGQYSQIFNAIQFILLAIVYYRAFKGLQWRHGGNRGEVWAVPVINNNNANVPQQPRARPPPLQRSHTVDQ